MNKITTNLVAYTHNFYMYYSYSLYTNNNYVINYGYSLTDPNNTIIEFITFDYDDYSMKSLINMSPEEYFQESLSEFYNNYNIDLLKQLELHSYNEHNNLGSKKSYSKEVIIEY